MTQDQLVKAVAKRLDIPAKLARQVVKEIRWTIKQALRESGEYTWPKLGTFRVRSCKARNVINPITKEPMRLRQRVAVKFHASRLMALGLKAPGTKRGDVWGWDVAAKKLRGEG